MKHEHEENIKGYEAEKCTQNRSMWKAESKHRTSLCYSRSVSTIDDKN